jgi:hypothetical protein
VRVGGCALTVDIGISNLYMRNRRHI